MSLTKKYLKNCKKPEGAFGRMVLGVMNRRHAPLSNWALDSVPWSDHSRILDVGCGGGANIARMFDRYPHARIDGIDYSPDSVRVSKKIHAARPAGSCEIRQGDVMHLPYPDAAYDVVTAFETVYFWPDVVGGFQQIFRVLRPGGKLLVVCELDDSQAGGKWAARCDGMTVYTGEQLKDMLEQAGFQVTRLHRHNAWICLEAAKPHAPGHPRA